MTGSAYSLSALVPTEAFSITKGEPVIGGLHGPTRHYFCPHCMSWMFTRPEGADTFVNVRSTLLDDSDGLEPYIETMTAEKLAWATTPAIESFTEFPALEDYGRLIKAYAEHAAKRTDVAPQD